MDSRALHEAACAAGRFRAIALANLDGHLSAQFDQAGRELARLLAELGFHAPPLTEGPADLP